MSTGPSHTKEHIPDDQFVLEFGWDELHAIQDAIGKLIECLTKLGNIRDEAVNDMVIMSSKTRNNLLRIGDEIIEIFKVVDEFNEIVDHILGTLKFGGDELSATQDAIDKLTDNLAKLGDIRDDTINDIMIMSSRTRKNLSRINDGILKISNVAVEFNEIVGHILDTKRKV